MVCNHRCSASWQLGRMVGEPGRSNYLRCWRSREGKNYRVSLCRIRARSSGSSYHSRYSNLDPLPQFEETRKRKMTESHASTFNSEATIIAVHNAKHGVAEPQQALPSSGHSERLHRRRSS